MQTIATIGLDIAKSIFQVHGVDAGGQVVIRRQLKRRSVLAFFQKLPPCLVGPSMRISSWATGSGFHSDLKSIQLTPVMRAAGLNSL
jgi:transposase